MCSLVTGVQTCALPISVPQIAHRLRVRAGATPVLGQLGDIIRGALPELVVHEHGAVHEIRRAADLGLVLLQLLPGLGDLLGIILAPRSEENTSELQSLMRI